MRRILSTLMVLVFAVAFTGTVAALTIDQTQSVSATATVTGSTSLSADVSSIAYGTSSTDKYPTTPANSKIKLTYSSNYNPWKIMVATNNTQIPLGGTTNGLYAKGGLVTGSGPYNVVACKWVTKIGTNTTVPSIPTATAYNYVKDKRDEDDPATGGQNESWATALAAGYPVIAYGDQSGNGFCVDPTDTSTTDGDGLYVGDAITASSGVAVYVAGGFATNFVSPAVPAAAGSYATSFIFDLVHE